MPSTTITDTPTAIIPPARRRWVRITNTGSQTAYLLVDEPGVTAEDGPKAGLPLQEAQSVLLQGTILKSFKAPFTIFAVTQAGQSTTLRYEDYNPAQEPVIEGSTLFNGFNITFNGTPVTT